MNYENFVREAGEIFLEALEMRKCKVRASQAVALFCELHGQSKEFSAKLCSEFRRIAK